MKKTIKKCIAGVLSVAVFAGGISLVANATTLYDVVNRGIKVVINGEELIPTDADGNRVEPIIVDGTTYLPVRAIANAFGEPVYWDGPNTTVYLGDNDGKLQYPTTRLEDVDNIGNKFYSVGTNKLTDNYGNSYSSAIYSNSYSQRNFQTLLNMKYSRFKCTLYVPRGCTTDETAKILIKTDGQVVYSSPEITKISRPIDVDVNIKGCNDFQIEVTNGYNLGYIANAGFYQ